jgi:hypothetical protein
MRRKDKDCSRNEEFVIWVTAIKKLPLDLPYPDAKQTVI